MRQDRASATALFVVAGQLHAARGPLSPLVAPRTRQLCQALLEEVEGGARYRWLAERRSGRLAARLMQRLMMPGMIQHYVLRKRFFEDAAQGAVGDGARQVVNLGAGFDTLVPRLVERHPGLTGIELDHPATSGAKVRALAAAGVDTAALTFLPVDFEVETAAEALQRCPTFDPRQRTVFLIEGVLMYLDPATVQGLLRSLVDLAGPGTTLALTFVDPARPAHGPLLAPFLESRSEPLSWTIPRADVGPFLANLGLEVVEVADDADLLGRYGPGRATGPVHRGECVVHARVPG